MYRLPRYHVVLVTLISFLLTACSGNNSSPAPAAPVFTSTPVTQAVEGSPYIYQLAASGTAVTFSLTNAPISATLSGNTISWTPTAEQSRVPDSFTVTATASGGPSATQSWTVTPSGTIRISHIDTLWNESGSTSRPFDWSPSSSYVAALVPQPDGSFKSLSGTVGANGGFEIPGVPAGYYWLKLGQRDTYWTSSSTFDVGSDLFVSTSNVALANNSTTSFNFSFTSLDPTTAGGLLQIDALGPGLPPYATSTTAGSTTFFGGLTINGNLDYSGIKNVFVKQYEPTALGSVNGYVLGPELTLSNLSLTTGGQNTLSGALNPKVPASINLSVQGSAWAPLFDHIAPTAPTTTGGSFYLSVQPFIASEGPNVLLSTPSTPIDLIRSSGSFSAFLTSSSCPTNVTLSTFAPLPTNPILTTSPTLTTPTNPPLTTDVEAGTVQYSDPFPSTWRRTFRVCQSASVTLPLPTGEIQGFTLTNTQTTSLPTAAVMPLLSGVQNPKINGADLFTATTISNTSVTLSWDPPAIGAPYGYEVSILSQTTGLPNGGSIYLVSTTLSTAKTAMTIPPGFLASGKTYLFMISSLVDGKASMETSPHRSLLPTASAELISAPITTVTN
ncbi:MAG TPA: putative Ig domain-containing protein [Edaphobacter sp.]|nr:putative Ig domain-containing protein [Edaphobacter sp.]